MSSMKWWPFRPWGDQLKFDRVYGIQYCFFIIMRRACARIQISILSLWWYDLQICTVNPSISTRYRRIKHVCIISYFSIMNLQDYNISHKLCTWFSFTLFYWGYSIGLIDSGATFTHVAHGCCWAVPAIKWLLWYLWGNLEGNMQHRMEPNQINYIAPHLLYPRNEVRRGILDTPCLSVRLSVRPSVCLSVCLSVNLLCPPCSIYSSGWILSIFGTNDH